MTGTELGLKPTVKLEKRKNRMGRPGFVGGVITCFAERGILGR